MRKTLHRKRALRSVRPRSNVDPTRMAIAALERLRTVLVRSGPEKRLGLPLDETELESQAAILGGSLPPSYAAAMRSASQVGERPHFLRAAEMTAEAERLARVGRERAGNGGSGGLGARCGSSCAAHLVCS